MNPTRFAVRSVCNRTNTLTESAVVAAHAVAAAIEVQVTGVVGVGRTERPRPVVAVLTRAVRISTVAPASSWKEDAVAVWTSDSITVVPVL